MLIVYQHLCMALTKAIGFWLVQVVSTLRALLGERVIEAFTAAHVEAADRAGEGLSRVGAMLLASNK